MNQENEALIESLIAVQNLMIFKGVEVQTLEEKRDNLKQRIDALELNETLYEE